MLTWLSVKLATARDQVVELVHPLGVEELGALLLAEADRDHLHQARIRPGRGNRCAA